MDDTPTTGGPVPACPVCGGFAYRLRMHPAGYLELVEPAPTHCAGPDRHPFGPNRVNLGWRACGCPPAVTVSSGGHLLWRCNACGDVQLWPPCRSSQ
jgi:hypothetical protein